MLSRRNEDRVVYIFQFQYGTIEVADSLSGGDGSLIFQFQYGTIEVGSLVWIAIKFFLISIPIWYD